MKLAVFGATGMAGRPIVDEALSRGHEVVALSRTVGERPARQGLTTARIDIGAPDTLDPLLAEADAAVLSIRPDPGAEPMVASWTTGLLDAAARTQTRIIVVGGAGPLRSPNHPDRLVIDDPSYVPPPWRRIAQASLDQLDACRKHPYGGWTYLSPPALFVPGPRTGRYRRGTTTLLIDTEGISRITAGDLAVAVIDDIESPGGDTHFTVAEAFAARPGR